MAPLMLKIPGKRASVHGARLNTPKYMARNVPAKRPAGLKDRDSKDCPKLLASPVIEVRTDIATTSIHSVSPHL